MNKFVPEPPVMDRARPGSYLLVLENLQPATIRVGKWGDLKTRRGYYLYTGSAFGPGGLRARVARHYRKAKRLHWHIDYLREHMDMLDAWCSYRRDNQEHHWARILVKRRGVEAIEGMGCSDCKCNAHLFYMQNNPGLEWFRSIADEEIEPFHAEPVSAAEIKS